MTVAGQTLTLPEMLDSSAASALQASLAQSRSGALHVDGQAVRGIGALCAQLLVAARCEARRRGSDIELDPSSAMIRDLRLLGLADHLLLERDKQ